MSRTTLWLLVALCCATLTIGVALIGIYVVAALQTAHSKIETSDLSCEQHFCPSEATKHAYPDCICKLRNHPRQDKFHIRKFSSKKLCSKIKEAQGSEHWRSSNFNCFLANRDTGCPMPASSASVSALTKAITKPYATGCPLITPAQEESYPRLIHDDHCVNRPFFSTYFRTKFMFPTFRSIDREVSLYLNNTMDKYLHDYEDFDEEVRNEFLKSEDFNNIPYELDQFSTFKDDYLGELRASTNYYFMFQWKNHPMYMKVLKDDDPLLTPSIELKDRPDRKKWREEAKNKIITRKCTSFTGSQPTLSFVAGGPSSGKSTFFHNHFAPDSNSYNFISADVIKEMDPIFQQIRKLGDYRAADVVHAESSELAREVLTALLHNRHRACNHIVFESAMGEYDRYKHFIDIAKANNMKVRILGLTTEAGSAMKRALRRSIINERHVHSEIVLGSHKNFSIHFEQFANIVDEVELYDTSITSKATLIASKAAGATLQIIDAALYQIFQNKKNINDDADNVVEVHEDTAVASPLGVELYLGSCAANPIGLERYIRLYLMMRANLREECVCFYSTHAEPELNK